MRLLLMMMMILKHKCLFMIFFFEKPTKFRWFSPIIPLKKIHSFSTIFVMTRELMLFSTYIYFTLINVKSCFCKMLQHQH